MKHEDVGKLKAENARLKKRLEEAENIFKKLGPFVFLTTTNGILKETDLHDAIRTWLNDKENAHGPEHSESGGREHSTVKDNPDRSG